MADLTATSTITLKKAKKVATQNETIAAIGTRTYTVTLPNPANAGDFVILGKFPAGCAPVGVYHKANATIAANTSLEYGLSATANGASPSVLIANNATGGIGTGWGYASAATTANVGVQSTTADTYLVATVRGNATAAVFTVTSTFIVAALDPESAPYSTFTF